MTMTVGQFNYLLDRRISEIDDGYSPKEVSMLADFYSMPEPKNYIERGAAINPRGLMREFTGLHTYPNTDQGYNWQAKHKAFSDGCQMDRLLYQFDLHNLAGAKLMDLKDTGFKTKEQHGARAFNLGFTAGDSLFEYSSSESVARFGTHTTTDSNADTTSGFTNRGTSSLTWTSLKSALTSFRRFRNQAGQPWGSNHQATTLVVPPELDSTAQELMGTNIGMSGVNSEQNIKNVLFGRYKIKSWNWLSDTNNWFLIDDETWKANNYFIISQEPEISRISGFDEETAKCKIYGSWTIATTVVWQGGFGQEVS